MAESGKSGGNGISRTRVICNPTSGGGDYSPSEVRARLDDHDIEWIETRDERHAIEAASEWDEGILLVIGGDGTVNDVVNGLGQSGFPEAVTLGILPTGTGNDFAQTLRIPEDPDLAISTLSGMRVRRLDAARASSSGIGERYFINVATGGFGAEASSTNTGELKKNWGKLSYLRASLEVASGFEIRDTHLTLDGEDEYLTAVNIAVGNCRYAGGGWLAAPTANPEDGLLDIVVIKEVGMREMLDLAPSALAGYDYTGKKGVFHARASDIRIATDPEGLEFTVDGEVIGDEPVEFNVVPGALNVIVGEDYRPDVPSEGGSD